MQMEVKSRQQKTRYQINHNREIIMILRSWQVLLISPIKKMPMIMTHWKALKKTVKHNCQFCALYGDCQLLLQSTMITT